MYMRVDGFWIFQNFVNNNGALRNEYHFFAPNKFYLGVFLFPPIRPFRPDDPQLRGMIREYSEALGICPVSAPKNLRKKN